MKRASIILLSLFLLRGILPAQDIQVTFTGVMAPPYDLSNMLHVTFVNNMGTDKIVIVTLQLTEQNTGLVYEAATQPFTLSPGVTAPPNLPFTTGSLQPGIIAQGYNNFAVGMSPLISGSYTWCINVSYPQETQQISTDCVPITQPPMVPPMLIYPVDHAVIENPDIVFTWAPAFVPGITGLTYYYKLIEADTATTISKPDFLTQPPYDEAFGLNQLIYLSPNTDSLKQDKNYYWSVAAEISNGSLLWANELWQFSMATDTQEIITRYLRPSNSASESIVNIHWGEILGFEYECRYSNEQLTMVIEGYKNGNNHLKKVESLPAPTIGSNRYEIDLRHYVNGDGVYLITLRSKYKSKEYIKVNFN